MYGSDEEQFIKWNERLQHCVDSLGKSEKFSGDFDEEVDLDDFQNDLAFLKSSVGEIMTLVVEGTDVDALRKTLVNLLGHQSDIRSTYQTKTAPTASSELDPKKIRYEKIIGQGGKY